MLVDVRSELRSCVWTKTFTALMTIYALVLGLEAWRLGVSVDEPSHILSATLYWRGRDNLKPRDMPPLIKIVGGWVPHLLNPPYNTAGKGWQEGHEWGVAAEMMERFPPAEIGWFVFLSRVPLIVFPLLAALIIWIWVRERTGAPAATFAAAVFMLEPTALGHGAFFKNDLAATGTHLFFWYSAWRFWRVPTAWRAFGLSVALLLAVLAKLSMLILIPIGLAIVCIRAVRFLPLMISTVWGGAIAASQFEIAWTPLPLPAPMWQGILSLLRNNSNPAPVFMNGQLYERGTPWYFLFALAVKSPVALQALVLTGLWRLGWRRAEAVFLWLPGLLYIGLASFSSLQMGVRLVLPALPFAILVASEGIKYLWARPRWALWSVMLVLFAETASVYPNGLAFFNAWAGGPGNGTQYLSDSSVDWGQGLGELKRYTDRHGIRKFSMVYFGMDQPSRYFSPGSYEFLVPPWGAEWARGPYLIPEKGRYYAVGAAMLAGHLFAPAYRDYYREFRKLTPIARPGQSMLVFRID